MYTKKVEELNVFDGREANHVLVNEYKAGQGILVNMSNSYIITFFSIVLSGQARTIQEFLTMGNRNSN